MKTAVLILMFLSICDVANASLELIGIFRHTDNPKFILSDTDNSCTSSWITVGDEFAGYKLVGFEISTSILSIQKDGKIVALSLKESKARSGSSLLPPKFVLSPGSSNGTLRWNSQSTDYNSRPEDVVVLDSKQGIVNVSIRWDTKPDAATGVFFTTSLVWPIPQTILVDDSYIISAEQIDSKNIIFVLSTVGREIVLKSRSSVISQGWSGSISEISKHISIVTKEFLEMTKHPVETQKPVKE